MKDEIPTQFPTWLEDLLLTQVLSLLPSLLSPLHPARLNTSLDPLSCSPSAPAGDQNFLICLLSPWMFLPICFDLPNLFTTALVIWVKSIIHGGAVRSLEGSMVTGL